MLLILAVKITNLGITDKEQFDLTLDKIIGEVNGGNFKSKTIRNQRTEMVRLYGLVKYLDGLAIPGTRLSTLSQTQDIPQFFKSFCKRFQFPGGFLKSDRVSAMVSAGVEFKPAQFILKMLKNGESRFGNTFAISAAEMAHFVFNDTRVTVEHEEATAVLERLIKFRETNEQIDKTGDIIRYARDFLSYMVEANLLDELGGMYRLNNAEAKAIHSIISDRNFFHEYRNTIKSDGTWDKDQYKQTDAKWMEWLADSTEDLSFVTSVGALVKDDTNLPDEWKKIREALQKKSPDARRSALKELGDEGEKIALDYEKQVIGQQLPHLVHLIKNVSANGTLGYDIISLHPKESRRKKFIEVKTTKKNYESDIVIPFVISINEWSVAEQSGDDYFIYRVIITKSGIKIFAIQNPALQQKNGNLQIEPTAYKVIYTEKAGQVLT